MSGNRIGVLDTTGGFSVKQGALNATWVLQANGVKAATWSGNRIGVLDTTERFSVKEGALNATWVYQANGVQAGAVSTSDAG